MTWLRFCHWLSQLIIKTIIIVLSQLVNILYAIIFRKSLILFFFNLCASLHVRNLFFSEFFGHGPKYTKMMTKIHNTSIIFALVGLKLTCGAIILSWFWPERASIDNTQVLIFSFFKNGLKNVLNYTFIITCTSFNILDQWSVVISWWSAHH